MRRAGVAALALILGTAGCGFQPVHGTGETAATPPTKSVRVAPIPERTGQLVHRELVRRLHGDAAGSGSNYRLAVELDERVAETGFRADETATRRNITLSASYRLIQAGTGETVLRGLARSTNSANVLDQPYATTVAERDARQRGANDIARKISRDIASKLGGSR